MRERHVPAESLDIGRILGMVLPADPPPAGYRGSA
jgi:hypothetical protein